MTEFVLEIHDDRLRFVRLVFDTRAMRDKLYSQIMERCANAEFVDREDVSSVSLRERRAAQAEIRALKDQRLSGG